MARPNESRTDRVRRALQRSSGLTVNQLAERIGCAPRVISLVLAKLVASGAVVAGESERFDQFGHARVYRLVENVVTT